MSLKMPIATHKLYKCPKCGYTKTIYQGDAITSFPICPKCKEMMELVGDSEKANDIFDSLSSWFK